MDTNNTNTATLTATEQAAAGQNWQAMPNTTVTPTALAFLNAALGIGQALATDAAAIASGFGAPKAASHITSGLQAFQGVQPAINDIEQLAAGIFGMFSALASAHAAKKVAG